MNRFIAFYIPQVKGILHTRLQMYYTILTDTKRLLLKPNVHWVITQLPQYVNRWFEIATLPVVIFFRNGMNNFLWSFGDNEVFKIPKRPLQRFSKMVRDLPPCGDTCTSLVKGVNWAHLTIYWSLVGWVIFANLIIKYWSAMYNRSLLTFIENIVESDCGFTFCPRDGVRRWINEL